MYFKKFMLLHLHIFYIKRPTFNFCLFYIHNHSLKVLQKNEIIYFINFMLNMMFYVANSQVSIYFNNLSFHDSLN